MGRQSMLRRSRELAAQLGELGTDVHYFEDPDGSHNEWSWARRFADVLRFLFPS